MPSKDDQDAELDPADSAIIKEVYDNENAHETFGDELERALELGYRIIIIEPPRLGDETARWITVGNCLHKTAVISGLGAVLFGLMWEEYPLAYAPLGAVSFFCTGLYTVSWQFDPCVKYQVFPDSKRLAKLPLFNALSSASPIVLIRKNDSRRKILHCSVTLLSTAFCTWKLYKLFNN
ncbi:transmembrane protein 11 homolog, mitochondrial [Cimex lectularius]|uniref:Transmembrane protein 11 homolog, mitochondrial n=1 Tax=Cimex lectularius TaxID=79782 RepID=A0A8I6SE26_CIMLE|nr:transmembrane protein 11 homolog, mitochondrial [Cimex lectularius]